MLESPSALNCARICKERRLQHPGGIINYSSSYLWGFLVTNIRTHVNFSKIYQSGQLFYIPNCGNWVSQLTRGLGTILQPLYRKRNKSEVHFLKIDPAPPCPLTANKATFHVLYTVSPIHWGAPSAFYPLCS